MKQHQMQTKHPYVKKPARTLTHRKKQDFSKQSSELSGWKNSLTMLQHCWKPAKIRTVYPQKGEKCFSNLWIIRIVEAGCTITNLTKKVFSQIQSKEGFFQKMGSTIL